MGYKLGLKTVQEQPRLRLSDYYTSDLPSVDSLSFPLGHSDLVTSWGMLANDRLGDCAAAAALHQEILWAAEAKKQISVTDQTAINVYTAVTGYNPENPESDQGTDVHELFTYWKANSLIGSDGSPIVAYAGLTPADPTELAVALSQFTTVFLGINVPDFAERQFEAGGPWRPEQGRHQLIGGHAIPAVGAISADLFDIVTWGQKIGMTSSFYQAYGTTAVVALTHDMFNGNTDIDGIDFDKLAANLPEFNTGPVLAKAPRGKKRVEIKIGDGKSEERGLEAAPPAV